MLKNVWNTIIVTIIPHIPLFIIIQTVMSLSIVLVMSSNVRPICRLVFQMSGTLSFKCLVNLNHETLIDHLSYLLLKSRVKKRRRWISVVLITEIQKSFHHEHFFRHWGSVFDFIVLFWFGFEFYRDSEFYLDF